MELTEATEPRSPSITQWLDRIRKGEAGAEAGLLAQIYPDLLRIARGLLANRPRQTLTGTVLAHEVYLRIKPTLDEKGFENHRHLFGAINQAMRRVLVDAARRRLNRPFRYADADEVADWPSRYSDHDLVDLDELLDGLREEYPDHARLLEQIVFAEVPVAEAAHLHDCSPATVYRMLTFARGWLEVRYRQNN